MHRDGGLAEQVLVPASALFALPDELEWSVAALAEPTAVAVHAADVVGRAAASVNHAVAAALKRLPGR